MMLWIILMCAQATGCQALQAPYVDSFGHFSQGTAYSTRPICEKAITVIYRGEKTRSHVFKDPGGYLDICRAEWVSADDDKWASGDSGVAALADLVGQNGDERRQKPKSDFPSPTFRTGPPPTDDFYPPQDTEQGTATVKICVGPNGKLSGPPAIVKSSGHRRLDRAALRWAQATSGHWRAAIQNGAPVSACTELPVKFQLSF